MARGFKRLGLEAEITHSPTSVADVHVVSGPHFAKQHWIGHPKTIWLDRAYYHEEKSGRWASMDWVSLGWLRSDGGREFGLGYGRKPPNVEDRPHDGGTIFLADYGGPVERADTIRRHPQEERPAEGLRDALRRHRIAVGYQTTALVTAGLCGLEIVCKDARNIMAESNWLELLPYADWHWTEIESGEALEHLIDTHTV